MNKKSQTLIRKYCQTNSQENVDDLWMWTFCNLQVTSLNWCFVNHRTFRSRRTRTARSCGWKASTSAAWTATGDVWCDGGQRSSEKPRHLTTTKWFNLKSINVFKICMVYQVTDHFHYLIYFICESYIVMISWIAQIHPFKKCYEIEPIN